MQARDLRSLAATLTDPRSLVETLTELLEKERRARGEAARRFEVPAEPLDGLHVSQTNSQRRQERHGWLTQLSSAF